MYPEGGKKTSFINAAHFCGVYLVQQPGSLQVPTVLLAAAQLALASMVLLELCFRWDVVWVCQG